MQATAPTGADDRRAGVGPGDFRAASGAAAYHSDGQDRRHASRRPRAWQHRNRRLSKPPRQGAEAAGAVPSFRWPVHGRIIAGFGARANGVQNDGINLAVPEGTPIKAAEDGVVAYAGNELKGYGNLVLIRHANGFVSAYANTKELLVKRGDNIKRGQVIAQCRADRQRDVAAAALRNPQGLDAGRSDQVSRRLRPKSPR